MAQFEKLFIGIAGMIGAGKTTLATELGRHLEIDVYYEPVEENEYLDDFYRDTLRFSFAMQIYLLNKRFRQHQEIIWRGGGGVLEYVSLVTGYRALLLVALALYALSMLALRWMGRRAPQAA